MSLLFGNLAHFNRRRQAHDIVRLLGALRQVLVINGPGLGCTMIRYRILVHTRGH